MFATKYFDVVRFLFLIETCKFLITFFTSKNFSGKRVVTIYYYMIIFLMKKEEKEIVIRSLHQGKSIFATSFWHERNAKNIVYQFTKKISSLPYLPSI